MQLILTTIHALNRPGLIKLYASNTFELLLIDLLCFRAIASCSRYLEVFSTVPPLVVFDWGDWENFEVYDMSEIITEGNIWSPLVAVIAEKGSSAEACKGMNLGETEEINNNPDPFVHKGPYEIIGFVKANIFDVDVSHLPPSYPTNSITGWKYSNAVPNKDPDVPDRVEYPWGFSDSQGTPIPCNLIRSRLACDQNPVPAAQGGGTAILEPVLVPDN